MTVEQSNSAATSNTAEQAKMWKRKERENSQSSIVKEWIARERMGQTDRSNHTGLARAQAIILSSSLLRINSRSECV